MGSKHQRGNEKMKLLMLILVQKHCFAVHCVLGLSWNLWGCRNSLVVPVPWAPLHQQLRQKEAKVRRMGKKGTNPGEMGIPGGKRGAQQEDEHNFSSREGPRVTSTLVTGVAAGHSREPKSSSSPISSWPGSSARSFCKSALNLLPCAAWQGIRVVTKVQESFKAGQSLWCCDPEHPRARLQLR